MSVSTVLRLNRSMRQFQMIFSTSLLFIGLIFVSLSLAQGSTNPNVTLQDTQSIKESLLWGTYKPYLISAVTQRSAHPITVGLAYSNNLIPKPYFSAFKEKARFRMNRQITAQYTHHNGFDFSRQSITDEPLDLYYDISFIKDYSQPEGSSTSNQKWSYLIYGSREAAQSYKTTEKEPFYTFVYIALEDLEGNGEDPRHIRTVEEYDKDDSTVLEVWNSALGATEGFFRVTVVGSEQKIREKTVQSVKRINKCVVHEYDKTKTWKVEDIIHGRLTTDLLKGITYLNPKQCSEDPSVPGANFFVLQVIAEPSLSVIVSYDSKEVPKEANLEQLHGSIAAKEKEFEDSLEAKLPVRGLNKFKFDMKEVKDIQRYALSNLLGGILHSYGGIKIRKANAEGGTEEFESEKKELLTASPSRVGFPRGFLWDEGFHQTVICSWNSTLCIEMIKGWLDTIQEDGWIPREQARGEELESNFMQKAFLYQSQQEANPPSMIIPLSYLLNSVLKTEEQGEGEQSVQSEKQREIKEFLAEILPKLKSWLTWFNRTQKAIAKPPVRQIIGEIENDGDAENIEHVEKQTVNEVVDQDEGKFYKWVCKPPCNGMYLASGLDDYPRHPRPIAHLDLHTWLLAFAKGIIDIEKLVSGNVSSEIQDLEKALTESLDEFLDPQDNLMKDIVQSDLGRHRRGNDPSEKGDKEQREFLRNKGYLNLFPFFFGALKQDSPAIKATLDLVSSPNQLWSPFGIRSLAKDDSYFMDGNCYWTEPIWIPMNFLFLRGLKRYYLENDEAKALYEALRENLVKTMSVNWRSNHNFWENYDTFTGVGKGFPSFTGWTSLIVLIYSEEYQ